MARAAFRKPGTEDVSNANIWAPLARRITRPVLTMPSFSIGPNLGTRNTRPDPTTPGPNVGPNPGTGNTRPEPNVPGPNIRPTPGKTSTHPGPTTPGPNIGPTANTENRPDPTMPPPGVVIVSRAAKKKPAPLVRGIISRYAIMGNVIPKRPKRKIHLSHIIRNFEPGKSSEFRDLNIISLPFVHDGNQNEETGEPIITNAALNRHRLRLLRRYDLENPIGVPPQNIRPEFLRSLLVRPKPRRVKMQVYDRRVYRDYNDPNFTGYGTFSFLTVCRIFSLIVLGYLMLQYKDS